MVGSCDCVDRKVIGCCGWVERGSYIWRVVELGRWVEWLGEMALYGEMGEWVDALKSG
ncbi:hypothetical protein ES703_18760 [subsurface metagenome]